MIRAAQVPGPGAYEVLLDDGPVEIALRGLMWNIRFIALLRVNARYLPCHCRRFENPVE